jgi:hypothetical protein
MSKGDFLAFGIQVQNPFEFDVYLATPHTTNFKSTKVRERNIIMYNQLLNIAEDFSEFSQYRGDADAVFSAIFGGSGLKLNPALIEGGVVPTSRGDMQTFKSTFEPGFFVSELNVEAASLVDLKMELSATSHALGVLATGKSYLASLGWYVRGSRTTSYAGLGPVDPFYNQASIPEEGVDTTQYGYNAMLAQTKVSELTTFLLAGKLVDVGTYAGATKEVLVGDIKLTGTYSVNHGPISQ